MYKRQGEFLVAADVVRHDDLPAVEFVPHHAVVEARGLFHPVSYTHLDVYKRQGFGCSPIKAARELGSERRETVRSLSIVGEGHMRGAAPSTRGPEWTHHWCNCCRANGTAGKRNADGINAEGI